MKLKNLLEYKKALNEGELYERSKRIILKRINYYKKNKNIKYPIELQMEKTLKNSISKLNLNKEKKIKIFEKEYNFDEIWFKDKKNQNETVWTNVIFPKGTDIKYIWEINRLQWVNYCYDQSNNKFKSKIFLKIKEWDKGNPFEMGVNWHSNLEVAIRSISLLNFYQHYKVDEDYIRKLLYKHGLHIYRDISYTEKCIPNNHLLGEATALYVLGNVLKTEESNKWVKKSKRILEDFLSHFRDDGTHIEGSLSYQRFTLQMYIYVYAFNKKFNFNYLNKEIEGVIHRSYVFLESIKKPNDELPDFGDNDEGFFYKFSKQESFSQFVDSLGTFLGFKKYQGDLQRLLSLFGICDLKLLEKKELCKKREFQKGKFLVFKNKNNYLIIHNQDQKYHSHSDGLSIELFLNGKDILIDPGTFSYNLDMEKRNWYRGTRGHNTVYLGENQTKEVGSFRWINNSINKLDFFENDNTIIVNGEVKTYKNKVHKRKIEMDKDFSRITVKDEIENSNLSEVNWHFSSEVSLEEISENRFEINDAGYLIEISADCKIAIEIVKSPLSKSYGYECERPRLRITSENNNKYKIITKFIKKGD